MHKSLRRGTSNSLYLLVFGGLVVAGLLTYLLLRDERPTHNRTSPAGSSDGSTEHELVMYCAAGMRYPMEQIAEQYKDAYGIPIRLNYGGSNTLLSQIEVAPTGDLYLAGDDSYIQLAKQKGLAAEVIPLAKMKPVIAVQRGNPKHINAISDLLRDDVTVALGNPDAAAIGKTTRELLTNAGSWSKLERRVTEAGVFKPTVNEVANDVKLGSVDAGIIWNSTVAQYKELEAVEVAELDRGAAAIELAVLTCSENPTEALQFARYAGARDAGLLVFKEKNFEVADGDVWEEHPEITLFAGAVNRRALEPILNEFSQREGVTINTVYNGCGILTATMRTMRENQQGGFPDAYMACDVYYLDTVRDWFQDAVNVSEAEIVLVVKKGNPRQIEGLKDLLRPDVRVVLGHPEQCTIGVLSTRLLQDQGIYDQLTSAKDIPMKPSSAMLVPDVITEAADVTLAYITDTRGESDKIDVIHMDSALARAVQPYSVARSSDFKHLSRRLYDKIAKSKDTFEAAGFTWRLDANAGSE